MANKSTDCTSDGNMASEAPLSSESGLSDGILASNTSTNSNSRTSDGNQASENTADVVEEDRVDAADKRCKLNPFAS